MKHKHHAMIVAKAENMELVVFAENINTGEWWECSLDFPFNSQQRFFLCLPQHNENGQCLHWLNGGDVEFEHCGKWHSCSDWSKGWHPASGFACTSNTIRIKPKKEKRWIAVDASTSQCTRHYSTKESCFNSEFAGCEGNANGWQFIEIEVEV